MEFQRPWMILLTLAGPLYWWFRLHWLREEEKKLRRFVRPILWERVGILPPAQHNVSRLLYSISIVLLTLAAAGPTWGSSSAYIPSGGANIVIGLDVSRSMWSDDESPTRLGRATIEIKRLIEAMPNTRFSLVLFTDHARLAVPITLDNQYILDRIPTGPSDDTGLTEGTAVSNLVDVMATALPDMDMESQVGIIFSDGGFHDYSISDAISEANDKRMALVTIGVGGDTPVMVPGDNGPIIWNGDTIKTILEEAPLKELAEATGGFYARVAEIGNLSNPVNSLLERSSSEANAEIAGASGARRFQYFIASALLLICIAFIFERRGA